MFASKTDIQAWLSDDKIVVNDANTQKPNIEAARIIKGQLAGIFSAVVVNSWADPDSTPDLIRSIAGRLAAAYLYARIYSEEGATVPAYVQWLYNGAILMINDIKSGNTTVTDNSDVPVDISGESLLDFWPNDDAPSFTMSQVFS